MDANVAARTLRLLTLLQARPSWSSAELTERTGTSPRTLRRDLARLTALDYRVESRPGPGGHYRLAAGARLPPMVFADDEVLALVAGLRMADQSPAAEAAARALVKLRQVLPPRLAGLADELAEVSESVVLEDRDPGDPDVLGTLTAAAAADRRVRFDYTDRHGTPRTAGSTPPAASSSGAGGACWPTTSTGPTGGSSCSSGCATSSPVRRHRDGPHRRTTSRPGC